MMIVSRNLFKSKSVSYLSGSAIAPGTPLEGGLVAGYYYPWIDNPVGDGGYNLILENNDDFILENNDLLAVETL